jgi:hypothetical protein
LPGKDQIIYETALKNEVKQYNLNENINSGYHNTQFIQKQDSSEWYLRYLSFK